jgi:hypothetical protein
MRPALLGRKGVSTGVTLRQLLQQRLGLLQVSSVKAFGEPAVDGRQQRVGRSALALALPQARQAHGRPQLQRLRLLAASDVESLTETRLSLCMKLGRSRQQQFSLEPIQLHHPPATTAAVTYSYTLDVYNLHFFKSLKS